MKYRYRKALIAWLSTTYDGVIGAQSEATWRDVFQLMDEVAPQIIAALERANEIRSKPADRLTVQIATKGSYYLFCRGYWNELLATEEWAAPLAVEMGLTDDVIEAYLVWAAKARSQQLGPEIAKVAFDRTAALLPAESSRVEPISSRLWLAGAISPRSCSRG